jgi:carboxylesterase type B
MLMHRINGLRLIISGESSGATSVGTHLIAYNGRDDKIFSGAIMESGNSETSTRDLSHYDPMVRRGDFEL